MQISRFIVADVSCKLFEILDLFRLERWTGEADLVPIGETGADWDIFERALGRPTFYRSKWKDAIHHAAPGGRLVLTLGNTLQLGTQWENYQAMGAAVRGYGRYPIPG